MLSLLKLHFNRIAEENAADFHYKSHLACGVPSPHDEVLDREADEHWKVAKACNQAVKNITEVLEMFEKPSPEALEKARLHFLGEILCSVTHNLQEGDEVIAKGSTIAGNLLEIKDFTNDNEFSCLGVRGCIGLSGFTLELDIDSIHKAFESDSTELTMAQRVMSCAGLDVGMVV